jgi:RimJ/RimL family protein N-acetyltransferase
VVAAWATDTLEISRLVWRADVGNHASRLVARRIGFTMEGLLLNGLSAIGQPGRSDGWIGGLRPGDVNSTTPAHLAAGSPAARRAATFSEVQPELPLDGADGLLRPLRDTDAPAIARATAHADIRSVAGPAADADARAAANVDAIGWPADYLRAARDRWLLGEGIVCAVAGPDGAYTGTIDFAFSRDDDATGYIGISIGPEAGGLAPAAARTLCAWAFDALGVTRVVWRVRVGDIDSRLAAERAGFTFEGTARAAIEQRGTRHDAWIGSLLSTDPRSGATT